MQKWYERSLFRNLVDMHIPNGDGYLESFDPEQYAENVQHSGATVAYIYGSNCLGLSFYPTKIGMRHAAAERDIFGETVKACRKRGLGVVGYLNSYGTFICREHPEWSVRPLESIAKHERKRVGNPCINNEEYIEHFISRVREFVSMYKLDGLWVDMVGIYTPVCFCDACQRKYGKPLPTRVSVSDPSFMEYFRFKGKCVADYAEKIRAAAKEADPDITVAIQCAEVRNPLQSGVNDFRFFEATDYMSGDFYETRHGVNLLSRILYKMTKELPFEFMTSRCVGLSSHTMNKDLNELILQAYAAMMYKGAFLFIDAIDPDGGMNASLYEDISVIGQRIEKYAPYIDFEEKPLRDVAVYFNFESTLDASEEGNPIDKMKSRYLFSRMKEMDDALTEAHIDYDIITPKNLSGLEDYRAVILPSIEFMSDEEVEVLRGYVTNGGRLYASGATSIKDENGNLRDDFALGDLFGVSLEGRFEVAPNYIAPVDDGMTDLFGKHTQRYPHMLKDKDAFFRVRPNGSGGRILATVTLPVSDRSNHLVFASALSNPPMIKTAYPALYENRVGKGLCIYSAGRLEGDEYLDNKRLFASLVGYLTGERRVTLSAPSCVDFTVYERDGVYKIHLLNHQSVLPPIPISRLEVKIRVGERKVKDVSDITGGELSWTMDNGVLTLCSDLDVYKLIVVETE